MKAFITVTPLGIFAFSENGNSVGRELFNKDPKSAALKIKTFQEKNTLPELEKVLNALRTKYIEISVESEDKNLAGELARTNLLNLAKKYNFKNFNLYLHKLNSELTKKDLQNEFSKIDRRIIQAVESIGELDSSLNLLLERLREFYSLYFPELSNRIKDHKTFAKLILKEKRAEDSIGASLSEKDLKILRNFAEKVSNLYSLRENLSNYLNGLMESEFKNLSTVATPLIGAKLLSIAGSAERLSRLTSSTIQVLGAERALFRHLKTGAKPPKYGVILQHPLLQSARKKDRGKIARMVSAKISIAIKRDVYGGEFIGDELKKELLEKINKIQKQR